jgi:hypothetical protein
VAHAQSLGLTWHDDAIFTTGTPQGVSVRQYGPTGDTFFFIDYNVDRTTDPQDPQVLSGTALVHYDCQQIGSQDWCETIAQRDVEWVGSEIQTSHDDAHLRHPAIASRHLGNGEFEVTLARSDYGIDYDCPNAGSGSPVWDIGDFTYTTVADAVTASGAIQSAQSASDCADHGKTTLVYRGSTPHACYGRNLLAGDRVQCNYDDGGTTEWGATEDYTPPGSGLQYDHPSFADDGNAHLVAMHAFVDPPPGTEQHSIRLFLDTATEVDISAVDSVRKNHPHVGLSGGILTIVHHVDRNLDAKVGYKRCNLNVEDCEDYPSDWYTSYVTTSYNGAEHVQHARDTSAKREFVAFSYEDSGQYKVVVGSRCTNGGSWAFDEPRAAQSSWDQRIDYGEPSLVLDRTQQVVHLAFVEVPNWAGSYAPAGNGGEVRWVRAEYGLCAP